MFLPRDQDTIAAISTPPGRGGLAVLRVSGSQALHIVRQFASFIPLAVESHRLYFGTLYDPTSLSPLDEVLVSYFKEGRSFTGEETVEISCHGGDLVARHILDALLRTGARLAERGEFTYRAVLHGKLDLIQAEGVLRLIESQSHQAAQMAFFQMKGSLSQSFLHLEDQLTWVAAHLEANIDFAQEDIEVATNKTLIDKLSSGLVLIHQLLETEKQGRWSQDGFRVTLLGLPNVGKSSLLNGMMGEEKAIVTDQPGTTRDLIEGWLFIEGFKIILRDTAGLRVADEVVEQIGVERSRSQVDQSDLILFIIDPVNMLESVKELDLIAEKIVGRVILVHNKVDISPFTTKRDFLSEMMHIAKSHGYERVVRIIKALSDESCVLMSATQQQGFENLKLNIAYFLRSGLSTHSELGIGARHAEALRQMRSCVEEALLLLKKEASPEFVAFELQTAVTLIHEVLGKRFDDQVMDRVFREFCLGK